MLTELRRVAILLKSGPITRNAFDRLAKVHSGTIVRRFGTWQDALKEAGLPARYSGRTVSQRMKLQPAKGISNQELIDDLRRVATELNSQTLSRKQFDKLGLVSTSAIERRFGSWAAGLAAAGLVLTAHGRRHSLQDYYENLLDVWTQLGRQPANKEMDSPPSKITAGAYEAKFGTWRKALRAFVDSMNEDVSNGMKSLESDRETETPDTESDKFSNHDIPNRVRGVSISLRYRVLSRDSFRCVLCGSSPATDLNARLHVDHIIPWSKGGKTEIGNLRTLCSQCNLGRGNKD